MNKYVFRPYDPIYPKLFSNEKKRLQYFVGNNVLIEHVGSTGVSGLGGKGFIDIANMLILIYEPADKLAN